MPDPTLDPDSWKPQFFDSRKTSQNNPTHVAWKATLTTDSLTIETQFGDPFSNPSLWLDSRFNFLCWILPKNPVEMASTAIETDYILSPRDSVCGRVKKIEGIHIYCLCNYTKKRLVVSILREYQRTRYFIK